MKYIMNYGGGVNSTAMLFLLVENKYQLDEVVFADTGSELPETYATVDKIKEYCQQNNIEFTTVKSYLGNIYDYYFKKKTVPSRMKRDCTGKFKVQPIRAYLRKKYGKAEHFTQYIGIALEELHRMRLSDVKYATLAYPLVDLKINREMCIQINNAHGFKDIRKSGCFFCPFSRRAAWLTLMNEHEDLFDKAVAIEENATNPRCKPMNEKDRQAKRNQTARLLRISSRRWVNAVRFNISNTTKHEMFKALECLNLLKQGHNFITEAEFENGKRADILDLDIGEAVEIAVSETEESLTQKRKSYPVPIRVVRP